MPQAAWILFGVLAFALSALSSPASAQDNYPSSVIRVMVGSPPSGTLDAVARLLAQKLSAQMNANVIIENKPGANGNIAAETVAKAKPDGYTLLAMSPNIVLSRAFGEKQDYDLLNDLTPLALVTSAPQLLVVHPSVPANTLPEFIAHLKANPDKLAYGSSGTGTTNHLGPLLWLQSNGLSALHVPYKGGALIMTDLLGGHIQFTTQGQSILAPLVKEKRLRALAIASPKRTALLPDVPTFAEGGSPFELSTWQAMMGPAKLPPALVKRLNSEILRALQDPNVRARVAQEGAEVTGSTPEEHVAYLKNDLDRWSKVIKSNNIKPE